MPPTTPVGLEPRATLRHALGPLVDEHCAMCHSGAEAEAGLDLAQLVGAESLWEHRGRWRHVRNRLAEGDMPPPEADALSDDLRRAAIDWLDAELAGPDCDGEMRPGRPTLRRLNRTEYVNTVRDLTGVEFDAAALFPNDELAFGFDNNGDVLSLSPLLVEKYLESARRIATEAILTPEDATEPRRQFDGASWRGAAADADGIRTLSNSGVVFTETEIEQRQGRTRCGCMCSRPRPATNWRASSCASATAELRVFDVAAHSDDPDAFTACFHAEPGTLQVGTAFVNDYWNPQAKDPRRRDRNLFVKSLELIGPLDDVLGPRRPEIAQLMADGPEESWADDSEWRDSRSSRTASSAGSRRSSSSVRR